MPDTPRDPPALDRLFDRVYDELRRLAHWQRSPLDGATLDTTALVHELYLQMSRGDAEFGHTRQFYAYAGRAMRHLLVDRARARAREKHGGDLRRTELRDTLSGHVSIDPQLALDLDQAIRRLEADDPRAARVVELHYFAGVPLEGIADLLEVSARTVHRDWQYARAFLGAQLDG
ncbi:MAG: sigma-70 family RNA polymerase sigma factor [Luteimonas sp.]|nr:sigma-70 family RNA polymerase sigma factor [Luteimonas sp.]